jgi:cephalosporin-C deacetylase
MLPHSFPFDPTYGFTVEQMLKIEPPKPPADFESFWRDTFEDTMQIPLEMSIGEDKFNHPKQSAKEIHFNSLGGFRIGGWIVTPRDTKEEITRAIVVSHGYGGRSAPDLENLEPNTAYLMYCARGFGLSKDPSIPGQSKQHVVMGLDSRDTYVHRGCAAEVWSCASVLLELYPQLKNTRSLAYLGGSYGGGIGALALPWDERFVCAVLAVPSFGNHPMRVSNPLTGSGQAIREIWLKKPEILEVLKYFDSAIAAQFIKIPCLVVCAKFDPGVPPFGQFSVYNAIRAEKELIVRTAAHFQYPELEAESRTILEKQREWMRRKMG